MVKPVSDSFLNFYVHRFYFRLFLNGQCFNSNHFNVLITIGKYPIIVKFHSNHPLTRQGVEPHHAGKGITVKLYTLNLSRSTSVACVYNFSQTC